MLDYFYFYAYVSLFLLYENCYLGFYHEQSRPDRDNYVDVYFDNIDPQDKAHNFNKCTGCSTQNEPYDFDSVMHYQRTAFGKGKGKLMCVKDVPNISRKVSYTYFSINYEKGNFLLLGSKSPFNIIG